MIIISFVVALMTAPVNLVVDFLFVEILSAPTVDSLKKESRSSTSQSRIQKVIGQASKMVRKASVASMNTLNNLGKLGNLNSNSPKTESDNWTELISTTRVIPPRTREAHDEAVECANDVISNAKNRLEDRSRLTKQRHEKFLRSHSSQKSERRRKTEVPVSNNRTSGVRSSFFSRQLPSMLRLPSSVVENGSNGNNNGLMEMSTESLFEQLTNDINQQRRLLKRSQQEVFDNLWG